MNAARLLLQLAGLLCLLATGQAAPGLQLWFYHPVNLYVDQNITNLETLWRRAAKAGYTHVLLSDSKFGKLGDMDERYFRNLKRVRQLGADLGLEIVPALFPIGYSNDLLWHDPNLIEALPVRDALLVVSNGLARVTADPPVAFPDGGFTNLSRWTWKDPTVVADNGAARVTDPKGQNARIVQNFTVKPFRQYHVSFRVKTQAFAGTPEVKVLAGGQSLNYNPLGVQATQDWQTHHVVFNSLDHAEASIYLGCWGGTTGSLWWDDAVIEEVAFLNLVRRPGAPLAVRKEGGATLVEGTDFTALKDPKMGVDPWPGSYDVYHEPPLLHVNLPDGSRLRADYYHGVTVYDGQAMVCPSEPRTMELLRDQARRMHAAWGAKGYFMSHDEIRVMNWCAACQARQLDAGAMLAENVKACIGILKEVNPGGRIYVWSDMFDPHHNAHDNYYLVRGNLTNSWAGLDRDVIVVPWYFEQRDASLKFFADRGHRQMIAGYYDDTPAKVKDWLTAAAKVSGVVGVMYTTWQNRWTDLEAFGQFVKDSQPKLQGSLEGGLPRIELQGAAGQGFLVESSPDLVAWQVLTDLVGSGVVASFAPPVSALPPQQFYRAQVLP
jgi:hypothetical protein